MKMQLESAGKSDDISVAGVLQSASDLQDAAALKCVYFMFDHVEMAFTTATQLMPLAERVFAPVLKSLNQAFNEASKSNLLQKLPALRTAHSQALAISATTLDRNEMQEGYNEIGEL